jgi:uncharacterized repeat protein (TIGR03803 family)
VPAAQAVKASHVRGIPFTLECDGSSPESGLLEVKGKLYGTAVAGGRAGCGGGGCGTVFSLDRRTGVEKLVYSFCSQQNCSDGDNPFASLIDVNGVLYGTTAYGGNAGCDTLGCGTVFSLDPQTGVENVVYAFCGQQNCADGSKPVASLINVNGVLYGTTETGGTYDEGTVFALTTGGREPKQAIARLRRALGHAGSPSSSVSGHETS